MINRGAAKAKSGRHSVLASGKTYVKARFVSSVLGQCPSSFSVKQRVSKASIEQEARSKVKKKQGSSRCATVLAGLLNRRGRSLPAMFLTFHHAASFEAEAYRELELELLGLIPTKITRGPVLPVGMRAFAQRACQKQGPPLGRGGGGGGKKRGVGRRIFL